MYHLGGFTSYTHSSLGNLIQLDWLCRSWSWPHSLWPRLTNISHCHQTALQWQTRMLSAAKPGACPVGLSWADLSVHATYPGTQNTSQDTKKPSEYAGIGSCHHSSILSPPSVLHKQSLFLIGDRWETGDKLLGVPNHPDFETPNLLSFLFLYHH